MTDGVERDPTITGALESIEVPDYEPGFWDRLDARLAAEGYPGLDVTSLELDGPVPSVAATAADLTFLPPPSVLPPAPEPDRPAPVPAREPAVLEPVLAELAVITPAVRRRGVALLGAAAAVALAVLALQLADRGPADPVETASGGARVTLRAPGGGSTTAGADDESGADDASSAADDADQGTPAGTGGTGTDSPTAGSRPAGGTGASGGGTGSTAATTSAGAPATADSPRAAFAAWAGALERGDVDGAVALTGPRTVAYHEAAGTDVEAAAATWADTYGAWAEADAPIEELEAAPSAGAPVVVLLHDGAALPVVRTGAGWRVEPDARARDEVEMTAPVTTDRKATIVPTNHVFELAAAKRGTYTLAIDRTTTTTIAAAKAVDGTIRWDPPDTAMVPGHHVLVVVHVTDDTITTRTLPFDVA